MSQAGYTPIQLYYSTTASAVPSAGNLANGEPALNITDGKLFYKDNGGVVKLLASNAGAAGDVVGPGSSTDNALVRFDTTTGKLVQNSVGVLSDAGVLTGLTGLTSSGSITFSSLTSGRVPYATTAGLLTDSANLAFDGTTLTANALTVTNAVTLSGGVANGVAYLNGSKVLTTGSALTFDGTTFGVGGRIGFSAFSSEVDNFALYVSSVTSATTLASFSTNPIAFRVNGSEQMRLTSTGLGIGTTSPVAKLDIGGIGSTQNGLRLTNFAGSPELASFTTDTSTGEIRIGGTNGSAGNYFPVFYANGSEQMRLTSTGLGIGTSSPQTKLQADGTSAGALLNVLTLRNGSAVANSEVGIFFAPTDQTTNIRGAQISAINDGGNNVGLKFYTGAGASITSKMLLDSSGNLGLGVTSIPGNSTNRVLLAQGSDSANLVVTKTGAESGSLVAFGGTVLIGSDTNVPLLFKTNATERARIDSSGNLLVGTPSSVDGKLQINVTTANWGIAIDSTNATTQYFERFLYSGTQIGYISGNNTSTSYVTSSDYRLKNTIAPMTGALAKVALLKPCTYKWNADGSDGEGFIAHELAEVVPQCVTGEKDAVDADGNPVYQGIDTSFLVATLTAAIQELKAEFDAYKASHP